MTQEQARQIVTNFLAHWRDYTPNNLYVKKSGSADGSITLLAEVTDKDEERNFEIQLDPVGNAIVAKEIIAAVALNDYRQNPVEMKKLKPGDRFRLQYDCVVYTYIGKVEDCSGIPHIIERTDERGIPSRVAGQIVYPCGK